MTSIKFLKLVWINAVSAAMHTDAHFGATKNVVLEATYHRMLEKQKIGLSNIFLNFLYLC
jgi:hypothetical protein